MNCLWGLKQHHPRVPPVSLWANNKAFAGVGVCPTWSYSILDAFLYICSSLLDNKSTYTPTVRIREADSASCRVAELFPQKLPHMNLHPMPCKLCYVWFSNLLLLWNGQDTSISFVPFISFSFFPSFSPFPSFFYFVPSFFFQSQSLFFLFFGSSPHPAALLAWPAT